MKHQFLSLKPIEMPFISEADIHIHRGLSIIKSHVLGVSALLLYARNQEWFGHLILEMLRGFI